MIKKPEISHARCTIIIYNVAGNEMKESLMCISRVHGRDGSAETQVYFYLNVSSFYLGPDPRPPSTHKRLTGVFSASPRVFLLFLLFFKFPLSLSFFTSFSHPEKPGELIAESVFRRCWGRIHERAYTRLVHGAER